MTARAATILILVCATALNLAAADQVGSRVLNGTQSDASTFPEVARITNGATQFTGTLISPIHILTSASAITDFNGNLQSLTGATAMIGGQSYPIVSGIKNPTWSGEGSTNGSAFVTGNQDIAILVLGQRVTTVRPAPIFRQTPNPLQQLVIAGFGATGDGGAGGEATATPPGKIVSGNTSILTVSGDYYSWTFDLGEADTATGDEGAPSFIVQGNVRYVAGVAGVRVTTGAAHIYGTTTTHARVDTSSVFIDSILGSGACDLTPVLPFTAPSTIRNLPGEQITVTINVLNKSATTASAAFSTSVYLSTNNTLSSDDILLGQISFPSIAPNVTQPATGTFAVPQGLVSGFYNVVALVDSGLVNQQTDYQNDSTNGLGIPQVQVTGNTAPSISSPANASVLQAFVDELIIFNVGATDPDQDPLAYNWNFADGSGSSGASVSHSYSVAGTYTVSVTVNDNFTGSATSTVTIKVLPLGTIEVIPSKFALNFRKLNSDSINLALRDAVVFGPTVENKTIKISLGQDVLDTGTIVRSKAKGSSGGKFAVTTAKGVLKYTTTKRDLRATLARYGAFDATIFVNVPVSVLVDVGGTLYGAQVPFFYTGKLGRTGTGKF